MEVQSCFNPSCHHWAEWSHWSQCPITCIENNLNIPTRYRIKHCRSNQSPEDSLSQGHVIVKRTVNDYFESDQCNHEVMFCNFFLLLILIDFYET